MAVLQLVKDDAKRRKNQKAGAYEPHTVVAVYEDEEIKEPASPKSRLYFVRVPGVKADYQDLLEDNLDDDGLLEKEAPRKKHTLDVSKLTSKDLSDIEKGEVDFRNEDKQVFKNKFKKRKKTILKKILRRKKK